MWPDRISNPGPLTYESGALLTALRDPAVVFVACVKRQASVGMLHKMTYKPNTVPRCIVLTYCILEDPSTVI